ncbi:RECEPTOR-LIKE PROTEIN 55 [Salix purpurea]|uniref:RECEPTOR-LIKE PROTEIN 55 n=1 Tax=Salix purpurea TaxID=77065 RepID=A0A9Q0ZEW0_SALPP|nr:RECEPTOR-LIKE PROTEIN 55 [Salix purpurea]
MIVGARLTLANFVEELSSEKEDFKARFERLSRLDKLESLNLGLNNFNNSILSSLKGLSSLKHLSLDGNQLNGSIDTKDFDSLSKLEELDLSRNEIQNFVTSTGINSSNPPPPTFDCF